MVWCESFTIIYTVMHSSHAGLRAGRGSCSAFCTGCGCTWAQFAGLPRICPALNRTLPASQVICLSQHCESESPAVGVCSAVRHEWLIAQGNPAQRYLDDGTALALSEISLQFLAPLRSRDTFLATVEVSRVSAARIVVSQQIICQPMQSQQPPKVGLQADELC